MEDKISVERHILKIINTFEERMEYQNIKVIEWDPIRFKELESSLFSNFSDQHYPNITNKLTQYFCLLTYLVEKEHFKDLI